MDDILPLPPSDEHVEQRRKPFNPKDFCVVVGSYKDPWPQLQMRQHSYYQPANIRRALAVYDMTPAQRELLTFIRDEYVDAFSTPMPNHARFFKLLKSAGIPISEYPYSYGGKLRVDEKPTPLKAEIVHVRESGYDDEADVRHEFYFRMPSEYWKQKDRPWGVAPFVRPTGTPYIAQELSDSVAFHELTPLLAGIVSRVHESIQYGTDDSPKATVIHQARLTADEVIHYDEIVRDASRLFALTAAPEEFAVQKVDVEPTEKIIVAFDNDAQTLSIVPVVDYGHCMVDVAESVYFSSKLIGDEWVRRAMIGDSQEYNITVEEGSDGQQGVIRYSRVAAKKEIAMYRALTAHAEEFGFLKKPRCKRAGKKLMDYVRGEWPKLSAFAVAQGYAIVFPQDELAVARQAFTADFTAGSDEGNDWLYFDLNCYCGDERVTLEKLLAYLESGEPFWRKDDGTLVEVSNRDELERLARLLKSFHARESGGYEGRLHSASELEYVMTSSPHYNAARESSFKDFMNRMQEGKPVQKVKLPAELEKTLRPYQKEGIEWLYFLRSFRFAGILADDMGLGKTLQALTILNLEKVEGKPSLIVCPKTLLYNWKQEAAQFFPEMRVLIYDGSPIERKELQKELAQSDLVVVSYGTLRQDEDVFTDRKTKGRPSVERGSTEASRPNVQFNYAVLDEAQFIKNHVTKSAQTVKKINADYRLALTGTPLENSVSEIWSMYDFLMPGFLGTYDHFSKHFHKPIMDKGDKDALEYLRKKVEPFMLRRTKAEVLKELPPKIEQMSQCHLSEPQNVLYQQILAQVRGEIFATVEKKGFKSAQIHILAGLTKLRQACNHPALLTDTKDFREYESAKLDMALELVDEVVEGNRKVLIFSQFTSMLDIVSEALSDKKVPHLYLSGKTKNRQDLVEQFNTDPSVPVFLISMKAGGTGLNLTAADTVIIFDPWWNPSVENQAVDRAHRMGQEKTVNVYRLQTVGTIEEKIQALKFKKQNLFNAMVSETGDTFQKLTWDDVKGLFT